jgi:guanine deaminase
MTLYDSIDQFDLLPSWRIYIFNLLHQNVNRNMESEKQEAFMREAIRLSVENVESGKGGPFAALVVKEGKIIARGVNQVTNSNDPTAHAEVVAIRNACNELGSFQLTGCEIYTSCEPCPMCLGAIYWARPDKLFFANTKENAAEIAFDDLFIYEEIARPLHERKLYTRQLLADEAMEAFEKWKTSVNKIEY